MQYIQKEKHGEKFFIPAESCRIKERFIYEGIKGRAKKSIYPNDVFASISKQESGSHPKAYMAYRITRVPKARYFKSRKAQVG